LGTSSAASTAIKIGFVLLSNSRDPIPSTRIAALNMFPLLQAANFAPEIVFEPPEGTETPDVSGLAPRLLKDDCRIVVFQKVHGPSVLALAAQLSDAGVKTVYGVCDRVNLPMARVTDATIAVTDYLKSLYPAELQHKIHVVHDGIENPAARRLDFCESRGESGNPLAAVLVTSARLTRLPVLGSPPDWLQVTIVGRYPPAQQPLRVLRETRWAMSALPSGERAAYLRFLLNRRIRCQPWDRHGVYDAMGRSEIGIIPIETNATGELESGHPSWKLKSENRLTMKMSMGLAVVATPIPAYERVIEHGVDGFFASSRYDWHQRLEALRDPGLRRAMGERARRAVQDKYSMERQGQLLLQVLRRVLDAPVGVAPIGSTARIEQSGTR
jgi:hypothetical protein